ncbi:MAG: hypothetical protein AAF587_03665 [Bacteroidota bacterium]
MNTSFFQAFILCFSIFLLFSCQNYSQKSMDATDYQTVLENKYGQKFIVQKAPRSSGSGKKLVIASPAQSPDMSFQAEFDRNGSYLSDTYMQVIWSRQLKSVVEDAIQCGEIPYVLKVSYYQLSNEEVDPRNIPEVQSMIQLPESENKTNVWAHVFANAEKQEELREIISCIHRSLTTLSELGTAIIYFNISIYDKSIPKKEDLNSFNFGFSRIKTDSFEDIHKDGLQKRIVFEWNSDQNLPDEEAILSIVDHKPNYFGSKVQRFEN